MVPELLMLPCRIVPQILIFIEFVRSFFVLPIGTVNQIGITEIGKFRAVTWAEKGMMNNHGFASCLI
jgi:ABC-type phosphate/phosphonate transport system permease subunit